MRIYRRYVVVKIVAIVLLGFSCIAGASSACNNYFKYEIGISHLDTEHLKAIGKYQTRDGHVIFYEEISKPDLIKEANRIDPHGFISNVRRVLGEVAAEFWGAVQVGRYFSFGDVDFINTRLSRFNQKASSTRQIPVRFEIDTSDLFQDAAKQTTQNELFLRKHAKLIVLIGRSGWIRKHDENYHVLANLYVPRLLHLEAQKKSQILVDFLDFLEQRGLRTKEFEPMIQAMIRHRVTDIDLMANAQIAMVYTYRTNDHKQVYVDYMTQRETYDLTNYAQSNLTALDFIKRLVEKYSSNQTSGRFLYRYMSLFLESLTPETQAFYSRSQLLGAVESDLASLTFDNFLYFKNLSQRLAPLSEPVPDFHL
jgi:hypothetical protein